MSAIGVIGRFTFISIFVQLNVEYFCVRSGEWTLNAAIRHKTVDTWLV